MLPFFPSFPNPVQNQGGSGLAPQQVLLLSTNGISSGQQNPLGFGNSQQILSQINAPSWQFQTTAMGAFNNRNMNNMHGNNTLMPNQPHMMPNQPHMMPSSCFPSSPNVAPLGAQSGLLGVHPQHGHLGPQHHIQYWNQIASLSSNGQFCSVPQNLNQIGMPQLSGQLILHGQMQGVNQVSPLQPCGQFLPQNLPTDTNQIIALPHGHFCSQKTMPPVNQIASQQCSQNALASPQAGPFHCPPSSHRLVVGPASLNSCSMPNSQLGIGSSNSDGNHSVPTDPTQGRNLDQGTFAGPTSSSQNTGQNTPITAHKLQQSFAPASTQVHLTHKNSQSGPRQQAQAGHFKDVGSDYSAVGVGNSGGKRFTRNPQGFGKRGRANMRFQKPQPHLPSDAKGNHRPFSNNYSKGQRYGRDRNLQPVKFANQDPGERKRFVPVNYTEEEIKQWREARKKSFPTTAHVEKKMRNARNYEALDEDVKLRRKQLREILAKQVELGVEVAELPPKYLWKPEKQVFNKEYDKKEKNVEGQFQKRHNKWGRCGPEKWNSKKQRLGNDTPPVPVPIKRKPTLLQKLLSADIKRDKSWLLQVFRFMTMNSFFKNWPEKPLEFPVVIAKDADCMDGCAKEKSLDGVDGAACGDDVNMIGEVEIQNDPSVADEAEHGASDSNCNSSSNGDNQEEVEMVRVEQDFAPEQLMLEEEGEIID